MTTSIEDRTPTGAIPNSLKEWIPERILVRLVLSAVEYSEDSGSSSHRRRPLFMGYQPKVLLGLLAYAYTTGTYRSMDVERQVRADHGMGYLSAGSFPEWTALMRFRRENRQLLLAAIDRVYRLAWAFRSGQTRLDEIDWDSVGVLADEWTQEELTAQFRATAEERSLWAIREDSATLDD